jgi:hypothetical protein
VSNPAPETGDQFILHGGRRPKLRNRAIILVIVAGIAVVVFVNALKQAKGDNNGSVGHLVVPAAIALACLAALAVTSSQWWEDATYFLLDGGRLGVRHGTGAGHGKSTWFEHGEPVIITVEGAGPGQGLFAHQGDARIRLADAETVPPLQLAHLEGWMRGHGFKVERR